MEQTAKILVVDDTPQNARLLDAMLSARGYSVVLAHSGHDGLEKVRAEDPDLVLLDIVMPDISGYEVCRRPVRHLHTEATHAIPGSGTTLSAW